MSENTTGASAVSDTSCAWNRCPTCNELVDFDDDSVDGSEVRCRSCDAHLVLTEYEDDTCGLVLADEDDGEESESKPVMAPIAIHEAAEAGDTLARTWLADAREKLANARRGCGARRKPSATEPIYDEVYLRGAQQIEALADHGDPAARAFVNAPVVDGKPDPGEPAIDDLRPVGFVPHEVVLHGLLERAKAEHEALTAEVAHLREREATLTTERDEARAWVRRITAAERVLTCVYCGEAYPPGTPEHGADVLTAHVRACAKHPMREAEAEIARLRKRDEAWQAATRCSDPDRVWSTT